MKVIQQALNEHAFLKGYVQTPDPAGSYKTLPALIILPGGAYKKIPTEQTEALATAFAGKGFQSFYLRYSLLSEKKPLMPQPLIELAQAVHFLRQNAAQFNLNPQQIAILGVSVGGHIAALYNDYFHQADFAELAGLSLADIKINAAMMGYPVISPKLGFPTDKATLATWATNPERLAADELVSPANAPSFVWTTTTDNVVPAINATSYVTALQKQHVSVEYHLYPEGPHGLALANPLTGADQNTILPHVATWFNLAIQWLNKQFH